MNDRLGNLPKKLIIECIVFAELLNFLDTIRIHFNFSPVDIHSLYILLELNWTMDLNLLIRSNDSS